MTKLGFMARGPVTDRSPIKRRKTRPSRGSVLMRRTLVNVIDKDGFVLRKVAVSQKGSSVAMSASVPKIKVISAQDSAELSFRMLNTLDARMKEEEFDAFE